MKGHGLSNHPLYSTWQNMIGRCYRPSHDRYGAYGGRGIMICDAWLDVSQFIEDMGEKPPGLTLERKDVNLDYTPTNCIWATVPEQGANKRNNFRVDMGGGRMLHLQAAADEMGVTPNVLKRRFKKTGSIKRARKWTRPEKPYRTLTGAEVVAIRAQFELRSDADIADMFSISRTTVRNIRSGKTWKSIP